MRPVLSFLPILAVTLSAMAAASPLEPPPVRFSWFDYRGEDPALALAGAGQFANPILPGFYPDPSVLRVGDDYYLVNSTFTYFPGLPVFHSRDLVHWMQIANAVDRPGEVDFSGRRLNAGLYAPMIHHASGRFFIVNTCVECGGNFVITAKDPAGPWSDPVWIRDVGGVDPSLFTDADGTTWLVNSDLPQEAPRYTGHRAIWIRRFDLATLKTVGPARVIVDGGVDLAKQPAWVEGPRLFRHDGRYYLMAAEGGTEANHSETVYRSDRPDGPFVPLPRPILTQRDLDPARPDPIASAGHAQLVETQRGDWWATFLAVRPYRGNEYNTGRETFLLPATWADGWPTITRPGQAIPYAVARPALPPGAASPFPLSGNFTLRDRFAGQALAPYWLTVRNPRQSWWKLDTGGLSIIPRAERIGEPGQPSFVARRQQHINATATTELRATLSRDGAKAGLVAYQNEAHYYFVGVVEENGHRTIHVERRAGESDPVDGVVLARRDLPAGNGPVRLRISARGASYGFDYATGGGGWQSLLAGADGSVLSTQIAGGFVGVTLGMYAYAP